MRKYLLALVACVALVSPARADFTAKDASAATITFKNANTCSSVVCIPQSAITDSTGVNFVVVTTAGVDGASNTANGLLSYARNLVFNGTTWDRWQGAVTNAGTFAVQLSGATNNINNISGTISLPTGAATSALQTTGNTSLSTIATNSGTQATAANQTTGNTSLATIATNSGTQATAANQTTGNTSAATTATQTTASAAAAGTTTDSPCTAPATATACTMEALLKALLNVGQYPAGATAITASATGTTAATTATLAGTSGKTTYICGLSIRANATGAATGNATVTGTITGTLNFTQWTAPLASGLGVTEQIFNPCVPASATNTGIAIISAAPGSGGVVSSTGWGYQL